MSHSRATENSAPDNALGFWRETLASLNVMQIQPDYPQATSCQKGTHTFDLNFDAFKKLQASFPEESFSTLIFTCLLIILHHYTQDTDICVGFGIEAMPIRTRLHNDMSFTQLLQQIKKNLELAKHYQLPNETLISQAISPQNFASLPNGLPFSVIYRPDDIDVVPLEMVELTYFTLGCQPITESGCHCSITYNTAMFSEKRIARIGEHLNHCLSEAANRPTIPVSNITLITNEEIALIKAYNQPLNASVSQPVFIGDILESAANTHPDSIAITLHHHDKTIPEQINFHALNLHSNQFANYLKTMALEPSAAIGISLPRGLAYYTSLFACTKSTHPFIPLEASSSHISLIEYKTKKANAVIVNNETAPLFKNCEHLSLINLDDPQTQAAIQEQSGHYTPPAIEPTSPIYHIFTSGSTGAPKAVSISHQGITNLLTWFKGRYGHLPNFSIMSTAPYTFDASICDIVVMVATLGNMHVTDDKNRIHPGSILNIINTHQVKYGAFTPEGLKNLDPSCALKHVVTMGASPHEPTLQSWLDADKERTIENGYGPTEATICSSQDYWHNHNIINLIGKPVDNEFIFVLNPHSFLPCPIGAMGEIAIAGPGIALGYLDNPALTQEKFITINHPLGADQAPLQIYRTGDYGCYLEEPYNQLNIHYHGRIDQQIKLFGVRIDISEIENIIGALQEVKKVVIMPDNTKTGLHAYIIPQSEETSENELLLALRRYLRTQTLLPAIAYPRNIILIRSIPVTPNGKIDYAKLPSALTPNKLDNQDSDLESYLLNLWADALNIDWQRIDRDNTYGFNGGDSFRLTWLSNILCDPKKQFSFKQEDILTMLNSNITFNQLYSRLFELMTGRPLQLPDSSLQPMSISAAIHASANPATLFYPEQSIPNNLFRKEPNQEKGFQKK